MSSMMTEPTRQESSLSRFDEDEDGERRDQEYCGQNRLTVARLCLLPGFTRACTTSRVGHMTSESSHNHASRQSPVASLLPSLKFPSILVLLRLQILQSSHLPSCCVPAQALCSTPVAFAIGRFTPGPVAHHSQPLATTINSSNDQIPPIDPILHR